MDLTHTQWRKASRSNSTGSDCVELAGFPRLVAIRDSKDPHGPRLLLDHNAWRHLTNRATTGDLDIERPGE